MTEVWPDLEHDVWYARCAACLMILGPHDDAIAAEVDADTHCPGSGGSVPAVLDDEPDPGSLHAEVLFSV